MTAPESPSLHAGRAQLAAVIVTIVVSASLAFGLPRMAEATAPQDTQIAAGSRVEAGGVSIQAPGGWVRTADTDFLVISKGTTKLLIFPPSPDTRSPADAVTESTGVYTADPSFAGTVGDVKTFTTDDGLSAVSVAVTEEEAVTVYYAFGDGDTLATGQLSTGPSDWADLQDELDSMVTTVQLSPETPS